MTETGTGKETGLSLGKIALYLFLLAAGIAVISLVLGFLVTSGIIGLPLFVAYALGAAIGRLLALAVQLAVIALIVKVIGLLRDRWMARKKKPQ